MNREHLIIAGGSLVIGLLVLANLQQTREDKKSEIVQSQAQTGRPLPQSDMDVKSALPSSKTSKKLSLTSARNRTFETRDEIQRQLERIESDYERSTTQAAQSARALFEGVDMDRYLREIADSRNISGNTGRGQKIDQSEEEEISRAFVRWVQSDPQAAKAWALAQNLQPVMTTLLRASADFAVSEAFESTKLWIDGIQESDLKEVAAWNFSEGFLRADPEAGKIFLDETEWLSPHAKGRVTALAFQP
jgi:hypothetical protein